MKIVIDISKEEYQTYINHTEAILDKSTPLVHQDLLKAVINGTPLPEQQTCEDCVSRKAVMFEIDESYNIVDLEKRIKDLPSVQPTRPKGKWIPYYDRWGDVITIVSHFKCSVCGEYDYDKDKFCPNCGADMRGEAE
jgi:hypothetical protein